MLGEQIRNIRKSRDFTLKALAEQTGLSIGYISQIERNLTDPSLSTLRKISAALDVPTYLFMGEAEADNTLTTRKNQVITLSQPHSNIRYHLLTPMPSAEFVPQSLIIGFELEAHAKDGERPVIHPSEEIIMVQSGELDVIIGTERIHLMEGDSTLIRSNLPHIVENTTDKQIEPVFPYSHRPSGFHPYEELNRTDKTHPFKNSFVSSHSGPFPRMFLHPLFLPAVHSGKRPHRPQCALPAPGCG